MSLSDINDRLMDGLGIISDKDALVLSEAKALKPFLRKINFPASLNKEFHDFLMVKQKDYSVRLQRLIETLEIGSKPIYFADLVNNKYATELKALNTTINHDIVQITFVLIMLGAFEKYDGGIYKIYFSNIKDYKLLAKKLTGRWSEGRNLLYEDIGFHEFSDQEIVDETLKTANYIYSRTYSKKEIEDYGCWVDTYDEDPKTIERWMRENEIFTLEFIPFDDKYYIMTRHKNLSNSKFRENIEFIADIPSITKGRSEQMVSQLNTDIELIKHFVIEKNLLKKESLKTLAILGKRLINFYNGRWMKDFAIPEL